jgi:hypothetical protein
MIEEVGDFSSIDPYKTEIMLEEDIKYHEQSLSTNTCLQLTCMVKSQDTTTGTS